MEHHSNLVPWQLLAAEKEARLRYLPFDGQGRLAMEELDGLLTERTKLVAVTHQSNVLGTINPVKEIARRAHAVGALVLVDGAQSVPHMPVDVQDLECDFLAFSAHKMCGPTGAGALWARYDLLDAMPPFHGGGEMIMLVQLHETTYKDPPHKFEAGTPNIADCIVWGTAIEYLEGLGMEAIRQHERQLVVYALGQLREVEGVRTFGPENVEQRGGAIALDIARVHPHDVAQVLDQEGIAVRAGHHCAQPLHRRLGLAASTRASLYLYNTPQDIDALVRGLEVVRRLFTPRTSVVRDR
jgi:cysteine desulfurase/selenocysteine lyase